MRCLVSGIRAQEILGTAGVRIERGRTGRLCRPHREAGLRRTCIARDVDAPEGVDVHHPHRRRARCELSLRERVDLCAGEFGTLRRPRIGVRGDIEAVRVRSDVRIVAEARACVSRIRVRPVIGDIDTVDVPIAGRVRSLAHRDVEVVLESQ